MEQMQRKTKATLKVLDQLLKSREGIWGLALAKNVDMPTGTVYPILGRLEDLGWVESFWDSDHIRNGPRRKYYVLNESAIPAAQVLLKEEPLKTAKIVNGVKLA